MLDKLSFPFPLWFVVLCAAAGLLVAGIMYWRDQKLSDAPSWVKNVAAILRFLSVFFISLLLLGPLIKTLTEDVQNPIIILAQDKSTSVDNSMTQEQQEDLDAAMLLLSSTLSDQYEIKNLFFSDKVYDTPDSIGNQSTNLSGLFQHIEDNYSGQNIGAILFSSDGIFNEGVNPLYNNLKLKAPVYPIALGDTTVRRDLMVKNVLHNKIAYLGDKFGIQVDISANNCSNSQTKLRIEKKTGNSTKVVHESKLNITSDPYFQSKEIVLDADNVGISKYTISLTSLKDELSYANNRRDIYVEVLDGRQKILVYADGPHPDVAAFKNGILSNKNYEVTIQYAGQGNPKAAEHDLVIFHNLPSDKNDIGEILETLNRKGTPRLFVAGTQVSQAKFNKSQSVVDIEGSGSSNEVIQPEIASSFSSFVISDELKTQLGKYPPLSAKFGSFTLGSTANQLLEQKIKKVKTNYPLLAFDETGAAKEAVLVGEGLWRWRIFDYTETGNFDPLTELINKSIQYLTVKDDKRKFRVNIAKNNFKENENILFDAQLYNDAYEMINTPDASIVITDQDKKEYTYSFSKTNNYYTLDAGLFPEGTYRYKANTIYNGENLTAEGRFTVREIQLELYDLTARHDVLQGLAMKYNGELIYPSKLSTLSETIKNNANIKPMVFQSNKTESIINLRWLFFPLLILLGLEWFLRRYHGSY